MIKNFKVGDTVRIVNNNSAEFGSTEGMRGYIDGIADEDPEYYLFQELLSETPVSVGVYANALVIDNEQDLIDARNAKLKMINSNIEKINVLGDIVKDRIEKLAEQYGVTYEIVMSIYDGVSKIKEEIHSPYFGLTKEEY